MSFGKMSFGKVSFGKMSGYHHFQLKYANADALSRLPLPETPGSTPVPEETVLLMELLETTPISAEQVKNWAKRTPVLAGVLKFAKQGCPSKCPNAELRPYFQRRDELYTLGSCCFTPRKKASG
jgi:hypothetical protein